MCPKENHITSFSVKTLKVKGRSIYSLRCRVQTGIAEERIPPWQASLLELEARKQDQIELLGSGSWEQKTTASG